MLSFSGSGCRADRLVSPDSDRVEVEHKWILVQDPTELHRHTASHLPLYSTSKATSSKIVSTKRNNQSKATSSIVDDSQQAPFSASAAIASGLSLSGPTPSTYLDAIPSDSVNGVVKAEDAHGLSPQMTPKTKRQPGQRGGGRRSRAQVSTPSAPGFVPSGIWTEMQSAIVPFNPEQVTIDMDRPGTFWYYLASFSTDTRAQYTEDPAKPRPNDAGISYRPDDL